METNCNQRLGRARLVSGGLYLALLISASPHLNADDQQAGRHVAEDNEKSIEANEQLMEPHNRRDTVTLVGPSSQEIHDFLYPSPNAGEAVRPAN